MPEKPMIESLRDMLRGMRDQDAAAYRPLLEAFETPLCEVEQAMIVEEMRGVLGVLDAMTEEERRNPSMIDRERARRIGEGCGWSSQRVLEVVGQVREVERLFGARRVGPWAGRRRPPGVGSSEN
ncbi:MAG TPA: hypothetical protein VFT74_10595 [Isosphaeraceae bacterium]|nr:hypothetical protein [Isosphaeraceae bacterium]